MENPISESPLLLSSLEESGQSKADLQEAIERVSAVWMIQFEWQSDGREVNGDE